MVEKYDFTLAIITVLFTFLSAVGGTSAFWSFMTKRSEKRNIENRLLISLARDRIIDLGVFYINRGWVSEAEYNDLYDGLYLPYEAVGGDGSAKKIMDAVKCLPLKSREGTDKKSTVVENIVLPKC